MRDPFSIPTSVEHAGDLPGKYKHAWTEESLDIPAGRLGTAHTRQFLGTSISAGRSRALFGIMLASFLILVSVVLVSASFAYMAERATQPDAFGSIPDFTPTTN